MKCAARRSSRPRRPIAAPPSNVMNSRRLNWFNCICCPSQGTTCHYAGLGGSSQGLAAVRDFGLAYDCLGSSTGVQSNSEWQSDLAVMYEKVGNVLVAQRKLDEALKASELFRGWYAFSLQVPHPNTRPCGRPRGRMHSRSTAPRRRAPCAAVQSAVSSIAGKAGVRQRRIRSELIWSAVHQ